MAETGFWWILAACALYGVIHSLMASRTFKGLASRWFGQAAYLRYYRILFVLVALITTLPLLALPALLPDRVIYTISAPWVYLTLLLQALGAVALLFGVLQTGAMRFLGIEQMLTSGTGPQPEKLVVSGLYRWVRHPLYTASFLVIWLMPVMTWNLLALNIGITAYMLIGTIFEEQKLVDQFGQQYKAYRQRTSRILPWMK